MCSELDSRTRRHIWVEFVVGFSPGTPVFPPPQIPTFPNSNSSLESSLAPISERALDIFDTSIKWIIIIIITIIIMDKNGLSCKGNGWGFSLSLHRLRWNLRDPAIGISLTSSPIWGTYGEMRFTVQMSQSGGWYKVSNSCTSSTLGFLDGCKQRKTTGFKWCVSSSSIRKVTNGC